MIKNLTLENLGKIIRKFRGKKTLEEVAKAIHMNERYLSRIEKGLANPSVAILDKLANCFNIKIGDFFENKLPIEYKIHIGNKKAIIAEGIENYSAIPLLRDPGSLGSGFEINEKDLDGVALIHSRNLKRGGNYQAIWVRGNSMKPLLNDGEIVAIDVKHKNPKSLKGKLVACHTGDYEVMVKRFWEQKNRYYFEASNKEWERENGPILTPKKDNLILGKVVWAWKKFE